MKGQKSLLLIQPASHQGWLPHLIQGFSQQVKRWQQLHYEREQLARMSDATLHDIGLSRADILKEVERPFWDDPLKK